MIKRTELEIAQRTLSVLDAHGVDNWTWYGESIEQFEANYGEVKTDVELLLALEYGGVDNWEGMEFIEGDLNGWARSTTTETFEEYAKREAAEEETYLEGLREPEVAVEPEPEPEVKRQIESKELLKLIEELMPEADALTHEKLYTLLLTSGTNSIAKNVASIDSTVFENVKAKYMTRDSKLTIGETMNACLDDFIKRTVKKPKMRVFIIEKSKLI